uniref:Uncharacterized protein n=1 Tax=Anguilla anguilla TaxID=7936 RepID=A0A0E9SXV7_ANGAN
MQGFNVFIFFDNSDITLQLYGIMPPEHGHDNVCDDILQGLYFFCLVL